METTEGIWRPTIIQGGMGAGVSNFKLANAVAREGQLGVVSGTALDSILIRRLQDGDSDGDMRRGLENFPIPSIAERVLDKYFIKNGKKQEDPYKRSTMFTANPKESLLELIVAANFVEVFLAKEGHSGKVGINYLEKIQMPNLPSIYGAMLAGVDYVLMGAGQPFTIPGVIDQLVNHHEVSLKLSVIQAIKKERHALTFNDQDNKLKTRTESGHYLTFNPQTIMQNPESVLKRPQFLGIIASEVLALAFKRRATGKVNGFIIEAPTAGGHNAPPRGKLQLTETGEPLYGPRDEVNFEKIKKHGLPFWLAGSFASPEKLQYAKDVVGACGIQVGTAFAFCNESGLDKNYKQKIIDRALKSEVSVFTDPRASPTGFPFKVIQQPGTISEQTDYENRERVCDLGYLREVYETEKGTLRYRCPSEPIEAFVNKGGKEEDTIDRKCLCNGLMANIGHPQTQKHGATELPLFTAGDDLVNIPQFLNDGERTYSAKDVIEQLLDSKERSN